MYYTCNSTHHTELINFVSRRTKHDSFGVAKGSQQSHSMHLLKRQKSNWKGELANGLSHGSGYGNSPWKYKVKCATNFNGIKTRKNLQVKSENGDTYWTQIQSKLNLKWTGLLLMCNAVPILPSLNLHCIIPVRLPLLCLAICTKDSHLGVRQLVTASINFLVFEK